MFRTATEVPGIDVQDLVEDGVRLEGPVLPLVLGDRGGLSSCNLCVGVQRRLGQPQRAELSTLRWRLFACAAVFSHAAGKPTLKLAVATAKRRN